MANQVGAFRRCRGFTSALLALALLPAALPAKEKLKPEKLVSLHLDAIGPAEARANAKSRVFRGSGIRRVLVGGKGQVLAAVFYASDASSSNFRFDTQDNPSYWGEHLIFDGKTAHIFQGFQNGWSDLGEFFRVNKPLLREGLLGGVTSAAWPLLALEARRPKLKYAGLKKVDDRELHRLDYKVRKGAGSVRIQMFFEPDTYRHVQTSYRYRVPGGIGDNPDASVGIQPTYVAVTETFWNFQPVDGLTLPANWKIQYDRSNQGGGPGSTVSEWEVAFSNVVHNEPIGPSYYKLGAKIK